MKWFAIEVAHYAALIPLAACVFNRQADTTHWLVAVGFGVSFVADSIAGFLGGSWVVTKVYPVAQFGVWLVAFDDKRLSVALVPIAAVASVIAGPDQIVTAVGSVGVIWRSREHELRWMALAYCGLGSMLYLALTTELETEWFMPVWWFYQSARMLSVGLFMRALWLTRK